MVEREKDSIHTFIEHMGIILNNIEDPLTKELLAHLVEEEEEHFARIQEMIPSLRGYLDSGASIAIGAESVQAKAGNATGNAQGFSPQSDRGTMNGSVHRRLSIGSLIQY